MGKINMFCAFRIQWFEKSEGIEHVDGYSYSFRRDDLMLWVQTRSNPTFSDVVQYRAGSIELVRVDIELSELIYRYRIYNCNVQEEGPPDLGLLSAYKASLGLI